MSEEKYKLFRSHLGWYSIQYPARWELEIIENIPAIYDPNGCGAFQISSFLNKKGSYDLTEEMIRYLEQHKIRYDESKVATVQREDGSILKACEFYVESRFWMVCMISYKNKLILCTYNGDVKPEPSEAIILSRMIQSVRVEE